MREERQMLSIDPEFAEVIEDTVIDWISKYPLEEGNLAIKDFNDPQQIRLWIDGVWGRITHQLSNSGLPYNNNAVIALAGKYFYEQVKGHQFYDKLKPHLPRAVKMNDPVKNTVA